MNLNNRNWSLLAAASLSGVLLALASRAQPQEILKEGLEGISYLPARSSQISVPLTPPFRAVASGPLLEILDETRPAGQSVVASLFAPSNILAMAYSQGRLALAASRQGLLLVDVSDPLAPRLGGRYGQADILDVELSSDGETAYVLFGARTFQILSLKDSWAPRLVNSRSRTGAQFQQSVRQGNTLLVAAQKKGVVVYSLADPRKPKFISMLKDLQAVYRVAVSDRLVAAFDDEKGLVLVDYSSWADPKILGTFPLSHHVQDACFSPQDPSLLVMAEGEAGLHAVNVADPTAPLEAGRWGSPSPAMGLSPAANGSFFVCAGAEGFWSLTLPSGTAQRWLGGSLPTGALASKGSTVYLGVDSKVETWDFTDPQAPALLAESPLPLPPVFLSVESGWLLACCQQAGVVLMDVSQGPVPTPVGAFVGEGAATQATLSGNLLAVAAGGAGVLLADISSPSSPVLLGSWKPEAGGISGVAFGSPSVLWIANNTTGILSLDISNPAAPQKLSHAVSADSNSGWLFARDDFLYQPTREQGINVLDISDPASPKSEGYIGGLSSFSVVFSGNDLYVADGFAGLLVMDVTDPKKSAPVGLLGVPGFAYGVALLPDGTAVASAREGGVWATRRTSCGGPVLALPCDGDSLPPSGRPIFSWERTEGAKYILKISTAPDFPESPKKTFTSQELDGPGYIPDLPRWKWLLKRGQGGTVPLYWKVVTVVGKTRTVSEIRTFRLG